MKKAIFSLVLAIILVPSMASAAFEQTVRVGSKGDAVIELQQFLFTQGLYRGPINGTYNVKTVASVKSFQKRENIKPLNGIFGTLSRLRAKQILNVKDDVFPEHYADVPVTYATPTVVVTQSTFYFISPIVSAPAPAMVAAPTAPAPVVSPKPMSQARLEIFNPYGKLKGIGRAENYVLPADPAKVTDNNSIDIGAILYDATGAPVQNATVNVVATDTNQNKILNGTGNILGQPINPYIAGTPYYPYHYDFTSTGTQTITFSADGVDSVSVTVNVQ